MAPPSNETQDCPTCETSLPKSLRYPKLLCSQCYDKAVDANGRALTFFNAEMSGGFEAHFKDDDTIAEDVTKSHIVFVNGKKVWADEARFGGIVLELLGNGEEEERKKWL
ncbi:hypothetical protein EJ08DRAFT_649266 [Tothia fuscella]|uniref:Uncharacterized protein n=1 Tax=Tothia fuscella TaxID=1048955 RepID=A0A9P4NSK4_9PEZI|nr:hypothetical protein EJ08DRAFT_649266 [Tothia fuscella]